MEIISRPPKTKTYNTTRYGRVIYHLFSESYTSKVEAMRLAYKARKKHGTRIRVEKYGDRYYIYLAPAGRTLKKLRRK